MLTMYVPKCVQLRVRVADLLDHEHFILASMEIIGVERRSNG